MVRVALQAPQRRWPSGSDVIATGEKSLSSRLNDGPASQEGSARQLSPLPGRNRGAADGGGRPVSNDPRPGRHLHHHHESRYHADGGDARHLSGLDCAGQSRAGGGPLLPPGSDEAGHCRVFPREGSLDGYMPVSSKHCTLSMRSRPKISPTPRSSPNSRRTSAAWRQHCSKKCAWHAPQPRALRPGSNDLPRRRRIWSSKAPRSKIRGSGSSPASAIPPNPTVSRTVGRAISNAPARGSSSVETASMCAR